MPFHFSSLWRQTNTASCGCAWFHRVHQGIGLALYLINPASLGSVRQISGMQMINSSPANSASM
jgi:hypothetical protein